jgi:hypothetical protein
MAAANKQGKMVSSPSSIQRCGESEALLTSSADASFYSKTSYVQSMMALETVRPGRKKENKTRDLGLMHCVTGQLPDESYLE